MKNHIIDAKQAAKLAGVSEAAIRKRLQRGNIPDRRPPGVRKIILFKSDIVRLDPEYDTAA